MMYYSTLSKKLVIAHIAYIIKCNPFHKPIRVWWLMLSTSTIRKLMEKYCHEFEAKLGYPVN